MGGGIVADDCGLGKTIQMLAAITYDATRHESDHHHRPTLIIVPPGVLDTWVQEWIRYFSNVLSLYLFHGSSEQSRSTVRQGLIINEKGFATKIRGLDPSDAKTSATIILTTYPTWANRSVVRRVINGAEEEEYPTEEDGDAEVEDSDLDHDAPKPAPVRATSPPPPPGISPTVCSHTSASFDYSH